jgi:Rrf2 family transcriptional regulator, cysteine metabolism repressor
MKLSTRCRYAVRSLLDLALNSKGDLVLLKDIARRQAISVKYLESIFSSLRKAGIIKGIRGARGGYMMIRPTEEVTIYDIVFAMQGFIAPVGCVTETCSCNRSEECVTHELWVKLTESIADTLRSYTVADLVTRHGAARNRGAEAEKADARS